MFFKKKQEKFPVKFIPDSLSDLDIHQGDYRVFRVNADHSAGGTVNVKEGLFSIVIYPVPTASLEIKYKLVFKYANRDNITEIRSKRKFYKDLQKIANFTNHIIELHTPLEKLKRLAWENYKEHNKEFSVFKRYWGG